jgi:hypothetical protein
VLVPEAALWVRRSPGEVRCDVMSNDGFAIAERYVSSRCWFNFWEGECVINRVALKDQISYTYKKI